MKSGSSLTIQWDYKCGAQFKQREIQAAQVWLRPSNFVFALLSAFYALTFQLVDNDHKLPGTTSMMCYCVVFGIQGLLAVKQKYAIRLITPISVLMMNMTAIVLEVPQNAINIFIIAYSMMFITSLELVRTWELVRIYIPISIICINSAVYIIILDYEDDNLVLDVISNFLLTAFFLSVSLVTGYRAAYQRKATFWNKVQKDRLLTDFGNLCLNVPVGLTIWKSESMVFSNLEIAHLFGNTDFNDDVIKNLPTDESNTRTDVRKCGDCLRIMRRFYAEKRVQTHIVLGHDENFGQFRYKYGEEPDDYKILEISGKFIYWEGSYCCLLTIKDTTLAKFYRQIKEVDELKTLWMRSISHELRTPLNGVQNMLSSLSEMSLVPLARECVEIAENSAELLMTTINDLLDFHQLQDNSFKLQTKQFSVLELTRKCKKLLKLKADEKKIKISIKSDSDLPEIIYNDPRRVQQIMLNLLENAIKYNRFGGKVTVNLYKDVSKSPAQVRVEIVDNGIGIKDSDFDKLFVQFGNIHSEETADLTTNGLGLGLWISTSIAECLGSGVEYRSTYSVGSRFWFGIDTDLNMRSDLSEALTKRPQLEAKGSLDDDVPPERQLLDPMCLTVASAVPHRIVHESTKDLAKDVSHDVTRDFDLESELEDIKPVISGKLTDSYLSPDSIEAEQHRKQTLNRLRQSSEGLKNSMGINRSISQRCQCPQILIVDDEPMNRLIASKLLEAHHLLFEQAIDGKDAVEKFEERIVQARKDHACCISFPLIIMDYEMPRMNGPTATIEIRRVSQRYSLGEPVIIGHSAYTQRETREEFKIAGVKGFLPKPLVRGDLIKTLQENGFVTPS